MNLSTIKAAFAVLCVASVVTACGSDGGKNAVAIDDLLGQVEAAECALGVRCHLFSDQTFCKSWFDQVASSGGLSTFEADIAAAKGGRSKYDSAAVGACLKAVSESPCIDLTTGLEAAGAACQKIFAGAVADDQSCTVDSECLRGSFCAIAAGGNNAACMGTCMRGGTLCNDDTHCADGQICDTQHGGNIARGTCVTPTPAGAENQICGTRRRCQAGLVCSASPSGVPGPICKAYAKEGEACEAENCIDGLLCVFAVDGNSATCERPAAKGEPCTLPRQCGGLLTSIVCDPTLHRCVDAPTSGPCGAASATQCNVLTSFCDFSSASPVCKPVAAIGAPCRMNSAECGLTGAKCTGPSTGSSTGTCTIQTTCDR